MTTKFLQKHYQTSLFSSILLVLLLTMLGCRQTAHAVERLDRCEYWAAPSGSNDNPGTFAQPWATLEYASAHVPDNGCTVWFMDGIYNGSNNPTERFMTTTTFQAVNPYRAVLQNDGLVIELDGVRNMVFSGFELRHTGTNANKYIVIMDRRGDTWSENVVFRNNIFHDSYNNDLLKIHNGSRFVTVENNIFYNQGVSEQHMDVNSVTDILIQDNIFFNDFAGSGRVNDNDTKHFIVVKDSNENSDGLEGAERITIQRNIFLNWEGQEETFVQIGNDGKAYHEAKDVQVLSNLMIGNTTNLSNAAFGVRGARDVVFANNTVVGDLPGDAFAFWINITELNPLNQNVIFANNIWSDPTGTMGVDPSGGAPEFASGDATSTTNLVLDNNLYWNGGAAIPAGEPVSPLVDDAHRVVADPELNSNQTNIVLPRWQGTAFLSGNGTIREEFARLVNGYGRPSSTSPAIDQANPAFAPATDILGRSRGGTADLGAYEQNYVELNERQYLPLIFKLFTQISHFMDRFVLEPTEGIAHDCAAR